MKTKFDRNILSKDDFEYNYNSELGTTIYDLGTVQLGQERNIILDQIIWIVKQQT